jgi:energy-converting hydrogenase Eha subunit E
LNNPVDPSPCFLTVKAAFPDSFEIITLIGNSVIPGTQTIANCPGRTSDITVSEKTNVRTVGVSLITFSMVTIVGWL